MRDDTATASDAWREAVARSRDEETAWEPDEVWVLEPEETSEARESSAPRAEGRPGRSANRTRQAYDRPEPARSEAAGERDQHRHSVPRPVVDELESQAGSQRGAKLAARLADASHAYDRERYTEARRILRPLAEEVPDSVAVLELYGLTLYRLGQWAPAARYLELCRAQSGSYDQHPVLADCYRALHRYADAEELWDELREASPSAELVAEGRIVAAGCKADQGDLQGAINVLERSAKRINHPQEHHLRQWYTLADLYERAGDLPRARDLFARIAAADPDAYDVRVRLRALR